MQLNAEDGGKRKFIMVQIPECALTGQNCEGGIQKHLRNRHRTYRRAGDKIKAEAGLMAQNLTSALGIKTLRTTKNVWYYAGATIHRTCFCKWKAISSRP
jgi:adenine-specific DNA-methyltransferase